MFQIKEKINHNLAAALSLLDIKDVHLRNEKGEEIDVISAHEHAKALFSYLNMAGYLSENSLRKAVEYLAISKAFACSKECVFSDLNNVCKRANRDGQFDAEYFLTHFTKQKYFTVSDVIDLIVFLQQTAFDRQFGVERDRLQAKNWMEHNPEFKKLATKLGVVTPLSPQTKQYAAVGIMGASSKWVKRRLAYFCALNIECESVWALSGNRELSKGLDEEDVMEKVAGYLSKPVQYVKKTIGVAEREYLENVTETMMVNYLIQTCCPNKKIGILDSAIELGHWRATTAQNAADIVPIILNKIQSQEIKNAPDSHYSFLIIAEQPHTDRMAKQVQREFNKEIRKRGLEAKLFVEVEGSGAGLTEEELLNTQTLACLNSELASLMAERFNNARCILQPTTSELRDSKLIMFSQRDETFKSYQAKLEHHSLKLVC